MPEDRPRSELAAGLVRALRCRGIRAIYPSGWEDYDARLLLSPLVYGELQTSSHPEGFVQVRDSRRARAGADRRRPCAAGALVTAVVPVLAVLLVLPVASVAAGAIRARRLPARMLATGTA